MIAIDRYKYASSMLTALVLMCFLALSGCATVKLVSDYDEKTDNAIGALQRKFEAFFVALEDQIGTDAADYKNHSTFYNEVTVDISAIQLRVSAQPKNEISAKQITLLRENVDLLEEFHKEGIVAVEVIEVPREAFNVALSNILRLELAKKRGQTYDN